MLIYRSILLKTGLSKHVIKTSIQKQRWPQQAALEQAARELMSCCLMVCWCKQSPDEEIQIQCEVPLGKLISPCGII